MNDLVYNEIVATPGFELEFAVGTTYSLHAEIFLALSLAFGRLGEVSDADFQNPLRLLEGLRQASSRVAIFCNRGGLQPPVRRNPLFAMLDKCVFEVSNNKEPLANFHPKLWIIKERSLEDRSFRQIKLIVLSRNLTKDTSLDVAVAMTAPLGQVPDISLQLKHQPLKHFLEQLTPYASSEKRKKIKRLIRDMDSMGRFQIDSQYSDYDFLPIHFGKNLNPTIDFCKEMPAQKMLIVSPFLDKTERISIKGEETTAPLWWLNDYARTSEKILVTRLESLTPEIMDLYSGENREVWVMSQLAEQNELQPMNLHAKMFFSGGPRQGGVYLWLGSANATHSAFYRNSEFMLRLSLKRGKHLFKNFKEEFCDENRLFQRIESLPEGQDNKKEDHSLAIKVRRNLLAHNNLSADVVPTEEGFQIKIKAKKLKDIPGVIKIAPFQMPYNEVELSPVSKECMITVGDLASLSEFYILSVTPFDGLGLQPIKIAIKIPTEGIPEERDDSIFRSHINSSDKFLNYVEMMLTQQPLELSTFVGGLTSNNGQMASVSSGRVVAHYESLLKIAATNPEKLHDLQDFVKRLDSNIIPPSFLQMQEMFKTSLKKLR